MAAPEHLSGWAWLDAPAQGAPDLPEEACRSAAACLGSAHGQVLLRHLRLLFLDRRVPPTASDAELRHVEGQRSVVSHLLQLLERGQAGPVPPSIHDLKESPR
ncbi:hypothetical protein [Benzoatithermus flavus]|uniref:Bbp19-like phage domain-containing protein n=1 Tax=Benzoatithermus flavus TaxID=3108223 RepID=A0ABU8XKJ7_9PROT